jgi:energy-coupling factor transporter ATP-binding protein EcfA2
MCALSESDSISLLTLCVSEGAENAKQVEGKEALMVIGNTGAGKSTFVNYLLGCEMIQKTPKELGITGLKKVVVVKSKSEGGTCDEVMPIGHNKMSKTFMPQIAADPSSPVLAYCDCSGFLDNRGAEINIANAVNIKCALQVAKCVKVLILINYHSLVADRGRGLTDMLNICTQLFGSTANLERFRDALLLGVTQVPEDVNLGSLREWLLDDTPKIMQVLSQRLFLYDPLNRGGADFWSQEQCIRELSALQGIPQSQSYNMFQTVLTADDEQKLVEIVEKQSKTLTKELDCGAYAQAGTFWQALQRLRVIDNIRVERLLHLIQLRLQHVTSKRVALFRECVVHYHFDEAQKHLDVMRAMCSHFDEADLELDLGESERHYAFSQKKQAKELDQERRYREEQERYAAESKRLLLVIDQQKREMESRLSTLLSEHAEGTSKLRVEMIRRGEDDDEQIAKLREESTAAIPAQAFGAEAWEKYFGEVGEAPPLPADIDEILDRPCPFWPDKQVKDTHLLVLIPATVGGVPFTLNQLGELIKRPKNSGHRTEYRFYGNLVKEQIGEASPPSSYWLLMTRDILPNSRSKTYDAQKALVAAYASKLGLPYEMPHALEAATAILLHHAREGERLFGDAPWTYTQCQEKVDKNRYSVFVGGFSSGGLNVHYDYFVYDVHHGVSCLRKF